MSAVNFSVSEDIKNAFNTVFGDQNKSAALQTTFWPIASKQPLFLKLNSKQPAKMVVPDLCGRRQRGRQVVC